jgi:hypothetical protein
VAVSIGFMRLKPAAPPSSAVWTDVVKRGSMLRQMGDVSGLL